MVARIWRGYTTRANAGPYEELLDREVFRLIEDRQVNGYLGIQLLKRNVADEVEFTTIMWFENMASVALFAGKDYERAFVPVQAQALLSRFDERSIHCEMVHERFYDP